MFFSAMGVALAIQVVYSGGDWLIRKWLVPAVRKTTAAEAEISENPAAEIADKSSEKALNQSVADEIAKLKQLFDDGVLTEEEYKHQVKRMKE